MSILSEFKSFNFNEGVPYISITMNGITFNKSVALKLDCPHYVVLLIDMPSNRIAIQACTEDTPNAVQFCKPNQAKVTSVRWNGKDLLNTLQEMTGWDLKEASYKVPGALLRSENAILFDLNTATKLQ